MTPCSLLVRTLCKDGTKISYTRTSLIAPRLAAIETLKNVGNDGKGRFESGDVFDKTHDHEIMVKEIIYDYENSGRQVTLSFAEYLECGRPTQIRRRIVRTYETIEDKSE
jgi:hypothetical protein